HTRAADDETAAALERFGGTVVLHCFSSPHLLPVALERGYYVSFAGNVTYPNAYELRAAARDVPADRILAETDSPYLSPQPRRGRGRPDRVPRRSRRARPCRRDRSQPGAAPRGPRCAPERGAALRRRARARCRLALAVPVEACREPAVQRGDAARRREPRRLA